MRDFHIPHGGVGVGVGNEQTAVPLGPSIHIGQATAHLGLIPGPSGEHGCPHAIGVGDGAIHTPPAVQIGHAMTHSLGLVHGPLQGTLVGVGVGALHV